MLSIMSSALSGSTICSCLVSPILRTRRHPRRLPSSSDVPFKEMGVEAETPGPSFETLRRT